jgi:hypothetical protein
MRQCHDAFIQGGTAICEGCLAGAPRLEMDELLGGEMADTGAPTDLTLGQKLKKQ